MENLIKRSAEITLRLNELADLAQAEKRELNEIERSEFNALKIERAGINMKVEAGNKVSDPQVKISRAEAFNKKLREMKSAGLQAQMNLVERTDPTSLLAANTNMVPLTVLDIVEPLADSTLFKDYTRVGYMKGDVVRPVPASVACTIEGEDATTTDQVLSIAGSKPVKKRISAVVPITKQAFADAGQNLYKVVTDLAVAGFADKLNDWVFASAAPVTGLAAPFVKTTPDVTSAATTNFTFAEVSKMKGALLKAKVKLNDKTAWVCSGAMYAILESTPIASGSDKMILNEGKILGLPVLINNGMGDNFLFLGDLSRIYVDIYDDVELIFDPITKAESGITRVIINAYAAVTTPQTAGFIVGKLKAGS